MTIALCVRCGSKKSGAMIACRSCDHAPSDAKEMAYSTALSDHYFDVEVLEQIAAEIRKTGKCPLLPPVQEEKFIRAIAEAGILRSFSN
ncbi:MAG: hypothetical protein OEM91_18385 [Hyphomicrobiales bacterium]|nr:hypothetical protein [Hyphomicrobiales bacterium]